MSIVNPYVSHYQSGWRERADDADLALWVRVSFLAYGSCRRNGHASFGPGELAHLFGKPADSVSRALRTAKTKAWLAAESTARCLVVPPHFVFGGLGHPNDKCAIHVGKRTGIKPATGTRRVQDGIPAQVENKPELGTDSPVSQRFTESSATLVSEANVIYLPDDEQWLSSQAVSDYSGRCDRCGCMADYLTSEGLCGDCARRGVNA